MNKKLDTVKKRLVHRIKIVYGHVNKIEKMIEEDAYCLDIVHQSRAVQQALKQLDLLVINEHLTTCVVEQIKSGQEQKSKDELLKLFEYK